MKFIELFAGIGGFGLALERLGHECVYANDIDKYCKITYDRHFKNKLDCRSITDVPSSEIPDHDLLCGGFPCQAFSIAGHRRGFADTRGTLFFEIARILKNKKPRLFILENVKGLLSHDNGNTFKTIIATLTELGYDLEWQVLNSKNFGVPQNRERVFIVGHIRGTARPKVFPIGEDSTENNQPCREPKQTANTLVSTYSIYGGFGEKKPREFRGYSPTIRTPQGGGHKPMVVAWSKSTREWGVEQRAKTSGEFNTLSTSQGGASQSTSNFIKEDVNIRRLTPVECERLQGFPDNWTAGVSDTQRYKQLGNAVTVNVVYEIAKHL